MKELRANEIDACRHRIVLSRHPELAAQRAERTPESLRRQRDAEYHRTRVLDGWRSQPDVVEARSYDDTAAAMALGAPLILGPRLRAPQLAVTVTLQALVRTGRIEDRYTYAPVVVKNHEITEPSSVRSLRESPLSDLSPGAVMNTSGIGLRSTSPVRRDGLLLSSALVILEHLGFADPARRGVVVDRQSRAWWFDLDEEHNQRFNVTRATELLTQRLEDLAALSHGEVVTSPWWHRECDDCDFASHCASELSARDDVGLVRFTSLAQQQRLRELGVATRHDLARLNPERASRARTGGLEPDDRFLVEDAMAPELERLDDLIYRARAHDAGTPLLRVESTALACPRADVEVDIDMESYDGLTYLWGATITSHIPGITSGHHIEVTWAPLDADEEAALFARWWQWWMALRAQCETLGASLAGYCFWAAAENEAMRRAARDQISEVNTFLASPAWVDMHDVTARLIQTDGPTGLKQLAQAAGFTWRDENPSGEASMLWYEQAVAVGEHDAWRTRVLEYNEDDCRATRALRDWLVGPARNLPHRDDPRWSTT